MGKFVINGRRPVSGTHRVPGNKNAALPMIAASLLASAPVTLQEVPDIADVRVMLQLAKKLGCVVRHDRAARSVRISAAKLRSTRIDHLLASRVRTSVLFAGPLLARLGGATIFPPGGDAIGHRRLDTHIDGFRALGAKVKAGCRALRLEAKRLAGTRIVLDEASVTATENLMMGASLAEGVTEIYNAACEPHIRNLGEMLCAMGAKISGLGTNLIRIEGVQELGGCEARVVSDTIEAASYLTAAVVTGGELTLENVEPDDFDVIGRVFRRFGVKWTIDADTRTLRLPGAQRLKMRYDLGDTIPRISDGPWPMFPSDLISILIVLASQTRGQCLFFEKMFESRLYFVDHLIGMGAKIVQCDPHRVVVSGKSLLRGTTVASPDIRAGIALIIAALCARGTTEILNAESIDRGYERVEERLSALGADIKRVD